MSTTTETLPTEGLRTLPGDEARQIMWRFADRFDLQMVVQSTRGVARGPIARMVADGLRNSHEWTPEKNEMLAHFDAAQITSLFMDPEHGGYLVGPKNLALSLVAWELAWVDAGAATCGLASNLGLAPIHERGTEEQKAKYMSEACPPGNENGEIRRAAFALTEPLPYVGVDTGMLSGRIKVADWDGDGEPMLQVEKRGRFITNMAFATVVTAAVDSGDERIKGSCMVILEEGDEGTFDRGATTMKMVHQLSSTSDPIFSLKVPASRIVGGYTVKDGVIVPNFSHADVIEAVFRRTRVTVAVMTPAKLISAVEPIIRYQRQRFRGGQLDESSLRFEMGIQQREDALHRTLDVWATGEAAASLGFQASRLFDEFDPIEHEVNKKFDEEGVKGRKRLAALRKVESKVLEMLEEKARPEDERDEAKIAELEADQLVQYSLLAAQADVFCPASKLWNTGRGATMMREALTLVGGYGITEDCPGFLMQKWTDAQLEATYEGPEAVQRRQLSITMTNKIFQALFKQWVADMKALSRRYPGTGACALGSAMKLWRWTYNHLQTSKDPMGGKLFHGQRQAVTFALADALGWLLATRQMILDTVELVEKGPENPVLAEGMEGLAQFYQDLCHTHVATTCGEVGKICSELVHGYNYHETWEGEACTKCYSEGELDALGAIMPGIASEAPGRTDVLDDEKALALLKAGPCPAFDGMSDFNRLRVKADLCMTGARLAKDRAAKSLAQVMIPEALDYPI